MLVRNVFFKARVLKRRKHTDSAYDEVPGIPFALQECWKFEHIPIEVGCKCARL